MYINSKELDFTFELNYKDLFYQNEDGNNYFLIIFNNVDEEEEHSEFWSFGEPLIKKYNLIFNPDSKQIGIYAKLNDFDNKEETFWVYGYHPVFQRKDFTWIYENLISNDIGKYNIKQVLYINKKNNHFKKCSIIHSGQQNHQ